ncbi:MAG TPA: sulfatase-like hydrolase/transferase, partial [Thermoanaerobaculia bacterium]|nr:sulfatase-like hydrolase/transferase [Thermoanaerobaculia bacterium]
MRRLIFLLLLTACSPGAKPSIPEGTPVVIISIDTLRADHLPAYGYRGVETPAIDRLRRDGILFEKAYSPTPLTF